MTIWFYVKTTDTPKAVGDVVCAFNVFEDPHPKGKYSWVMQRSKGEEEYWQIMGKYKNIKEQSIVASVHRAGDAVVLGEVAVGLVPSFMDPLLEKYGFDKICAVAPTPKNRSKLGQSTASQTPRNDLHTLNDTPQQST